MDIVAYVAPDHPLLPKITWKPEYGMLRPIIVDIKTSAKDFPEAQGMAAFDKQLRRYSWLANIRDAGLLWFKKTGHMISKGSSVTLLVDAGSFKAGQEAVAAYPTKEGIWLVSSDYFVEEMEKAQGRKEDGDLDNTKAGKERKMLWLTQNACRVPETALTRQRVQFNCGWISVESAEDAGLIAGRQIVQIVNSWKTKKWPSTFGIRFPSDDTRDPYFRAFVMGDKAFEKEHFVKTDDESLNDLFAEPEEDEDGQ